MNYEYDKSGIFFSYFITSIVGIVLIPYSIWIWGWLSNRRRVYALRIGSSESQKRSIDTTDTSESQNGNIDLKKTLKDRLLNSLGDERVGSILPVINNVGSIKPNTVAIDGSSADRKLNALNAKKLKSSKSSRSFRFHLSIWALLFMAFLALASWTIYQQRNFINNDNSDEKGPFNPWEILGLKESATMKQIKKQFKLLSLKYHPDKAQTNSDDPEEAQKVFVKISKAYQVLTDEETRENWEQYGNPDGQSYVSYGIALPSWIVDSKANKWLVLIIYSLIFGFLMPISVGRWWSRSKRYTRDGILNTTMALFVKELQETFGPKKMLEVLCTATEFKVDVPWRGGVDKKEVDLLFEKVREEVYKKTKDRLEFPRKYNANYVKKSFAITYAHLFRVPIASQNLKEDASYIIPKMRQLLLKGMLPICSSHFWIRQSIWCTQLAAMLIHAIPAASAGLAGPSGSLGASWTHSESSELMMLPFMDVKLIKKLARRIKGVSGGVRYIYELFGVAGGKLGKRVEFIRNLLLECEDETLDTKSAPKSPTSPKSPKSFNVENTSLEKVQLINQKVASLLHTARRIPQLTIERAEFKCEGESRITPGSLVTFELVLKAIDRRGEGLVDAIRTLKLVGDKGQKSLVDSSLNPESDDFDQNAVDSLVFADWDYALIEGGDQNASGGEFWEPDEELEKLVISEDLEKKRLVKNGDVAPQGVTPGTNLEKRAKEDFIGASNILDDSLLSAKPKRQATRSSKMIKLLSGNFSRNPNMPVYCPYYPFNPDLEDDGDGETDGNLVGLTPGSAIVRPKYWMWLCNLKNNRSAGQPKVINNLVPLPAHLDKPEEKLRGRVLIKYKLYAPQQPGSYTFNLRVDSDTYVGCYAQKDVRMVVVNFDKVEEAKREQMVKDYWKEYDEDEEEFRQMLMGGSQSILGAPGGLGGASGSSDRADDASDFDSDSTNSSENDDSDIESDSDSD